MLPIDSESTHLGCLLLLLRSVHRFENVARVVCLRHARRSGEWSERNRAGLPQIWGEIPGIEVPT